MSLRYRAARWNQRRPPPAVDERLAPAGATPLQNVMPSGITTRAYYLRAEPFEGCFLAYHFGHDEDPAETGAVELIQRAHGGGCDVLVLTMPLMHGNPRPVVETEFGPVRFTDHAAFALLPETGEFRPLRNFLETAALGLNFAHQERGSFDLVAMAGLSGGGWTTTIYAALDPRIHVSFPVAGSLPLALRGEQAYIGDWEQTLPSLYRLASYLDFYALATYPKRHQVQMLNRHDSCCMRGSEAATQFEPKVARAAESWGGSFRLSIDDEITHHGIAPRHVDEILATMTRMGGPTFPARVDHCRDGAVAATLRAPFTSGGGVAFTAMVKSLPPGDTAASPWNSPLVLCEDGRALGPSHAVHDDIRQTGRGRFSHWHDMLYFSTSDNSDPNGNGRTYTLVQP